MYELVLRWSGVCVCVKACGEGLVSEYCLKHEVCLRELQLRQMLGWTGSIRFGVIAQALCLVDNQLGCQSLWMLILYVGYKYFPPSAKFKQDDPPPTLPLPATVSPCH